MPRFLEPGRSLTGNLPFSPRKRMRPERLLAIVVLFHRTL